jgi:hypothetical protein
MIIHKGAAPRLCAFIVAAVLTVLTVATPLSAFADAALCSLLFSDHLDASKLTIRSYVDDDDYTNFELFHGEQKIAYVDISIARSGLVTIGYLHVDEGFRRKGASQILLKNVVEHIGRTRTYRTALVSDNVVAFAKAYRNIGDPESTLYSPYLTESQRLASALKQTPAYKVRVRLGISKIVRFEVEDCHPGNCKHPAVAFESTSDQSHN